MMENPQHELLPDLCAYKCNDIQISYCHESEYKLRFVRPPMHSQQMLLAEHALRTDVLYILLIQAYMFDFPNSTLRETLPT